MSKSMIILILVAVFFGVLLWNFGGRDVTFQAPYYVQRVLKKTAVVKIGKTTIDAEVAKTTAQLYKGLSGREGIQEGKGMLFVFPQSDKYAITMRGMKIPIDIIWIGEGKVVYMQNDAQPPKEGEDPTVFTPPLPADYILESDARLIERSLVSLGDAVEITFLTPSSAANVNAEAASP